MMSTTTTSAFDAPDALAMFVNSNKSQSCSSMSTDETIVMGQQTTAPTSTSGLLNAATFRTNLIKSTIREMNDAVVASQNKLLVDLETRCALIQAERDRLTVINNMLLVQLKDSTNVISENEHLKQQLAKAVKATPIFTTANNNQLDESFSSIHTNNNNDNNTNHNQHNNNYNTTTNNNNNNNSIIVANSSNSPNHAKTPNSNSKPQQTNRFHGVRANSLANEIAEEIAFALHQSQSHHQLQDEHEHKLETKHSPIKTRSPMMPQHKLSQRQRQRRTTINTTNSTDTVNTKTKTTANDDDDNTNTTTTNTTTHTTNDNDDVEEYIPDAADFATLKSQLDWSQRECRKLRDERVASDELRNKMVAEANDDVRAMTLELSKTKDELTRTYEAHKIALQKRRNKTTTMLEATDSIVADVTRWNSHGVVSALANARLTGELAEARSLAIRLIPTLCQKIRQLEDDRDRMASDAAKHSWDSVRGSMKTSMDSVSKLFTRRPSSSSPTPSSPSSS